MPYDYPQCPKCGRHHQRIKIVKTDKHSKKKWYVLTCPDCEHESDVEEYKPNKGIGNYPSSANKYPPTAEGSDESWWEDDN